MFKGRFNISNTARRKKYGEDVFDKI